jgi:D-tyrosyl-tRNA(Tyr) deacylase
MEICNKGEISVRAVVTRVQEAAVVIDGIVNGQIKQGFLILLGIAPEDTEKEVIKLADKICGTRVFEDENGKMNLNLETVGGELLIVSQFTLFADLKSRRPGFSAAAKPSIAIPLYEQFIKACQSKGFHVEHGEFGADMKVSSINDGPVTLLFDTDHL